MKKYSLYSESDSSVVLSSFEPPVIRREFYDEPGIRPVHSSEEAHFPNGRNEDVAEMGDLPVDRSHHRHNGLDILRIASRKPSVPEVTSSSIRIGVLSHSWMIQQVAHLLIGMLFLVQTYLFSNHPLSFFGVNDPMVLCFRVILEMTFSVVAGVLGIMFPALCLPLELCRVVYVIHSQPLQTLWNSHRYQLLIPSFVTILWIRGLVEKSTSLCNRFWKPMLLSGFYVLSLAVLFAVMEFSDFFFGTKTEDNCEFRQERLRVAVSVFFQLLMMIAAFVYLSDYERRRLDRSLEYRKDGMLALVETLSHESKTALNGIVPLLSEVHHKLMYTSSSTFPRKEDLPVFDPEISEFVDLSSFHSARDVFKVLVRCLETRCYEISLATQGLIDMYRMDWSVVSLSLNWCHLVPVLKQRLHRFFPKPGVDRLVQVDWDSFPRSVHVDRHYLMMAISHILSNATRFTTEGQIGVNISFEDGFFRFECCDTGCGISEEVLKKVYEPLALLEDGSQMTNLGLALSRCIIDSMKGKLRLHSVLGKGTDCSFFVPLRFRLGVVGENEDPEKSSGEQVQHADRVICFIADDEIVNRKVVGMLARRAGIVNVHLSEDGQECLDQIRDVNPQEPFLVLTDLGMPVLDGIGLVRQLRRQSLSCHVVAITARMVNRNAEFCRTYGFEQILGKPVHFGDIRDIVETFISDRLKYGLDFAGAGADGESEGNEAESEGEKSLPSVESPVVGVDLPSDKGLLLTRLANNGGDEPIPVGPSAMLVRFLSNYLPAHPYILSLATLFWSFFPWQMVYSANWFINVNACIQFVFIVGVVITRTQTDLAGAPPTVISSAVLSMMVVVVCDPFCVPEFICLAGAVSYARCSRNTPLWSKLKRASGLLGAFLVLRISSELYFGYGRTQNVMRLGCVLSLLSKSITSVLVSLHDDEFEELRLCSLVNKYNKHVSTEAALVTKLAHDAKETLSSMSSISCELHRQLRLLGDQSLIESVSIVRSSVDDLETRISNLLLLCRMKDGNLDLAPVRVNLEGLVQSVFERQVGIRGNSRVLYRFQTRNESTELCIDETFFRQIVKALISNALRFTEEGSVVVSVVVDGSVIQVTVRDTGCGMSPEKIVEINAKRSETVETLKLCELGSRFVGIDVARGLARASCSGSIVIHSEGIGLGTTAIFRCNLEKTEGMGSEEQAQ